MENEQFSPEDSLQLIQSMINKTKNTVLDDSFYFLLWGWLVLASCALQYGLKVIVKSPYHGNAWLLMPVGIVFSVLHGVKQSKTRQVKTYVEELLNNVWVGIFFAYILFFLIFARIGWEHCYSFFMLLYAIGTFVTGRTLHFPPLVWGAIGSWILAAISTFVSGDVNILLCALAILVSYIIPGYMLRASFKNKM